MKTTLFFVFLFLIQTKTAAQEYVFGKVLSEDQRELKGVYIINISNQQTAISDDDGNFMISAKIGDEIRFTKERYNRNSVKINSSNISKSFLIRLEIIPYDIEEVEIKYKITGDVNKDGSNLGKTKKVLKLQTDMGKYLRQKSDAATMAPKAGEFVQPIGEGFSIGGSKPAWDDLDFITT